MTRLQGVLVLGLAWLVGFGAARLPPEPQAPDLPRAPPPSPPARCPQAAQAPGLALEPPEVVPFLQSLTADLVLVDCEAYPCQGGAWFPEEAEALEMLGLLSARYPGTWTRHWPAEDGGTLISFVVASQELEDDELRQLIGPVSTAVAIEFAD